MSEVCCPRGKRVYATEHDARTALLGAVIARNNGQNRRRECRIYRCTRCGFWHLTSAVYDPNRDPERRAS